MTSWDFMIAMAQMNIAFGILYITLRSARYRERTYEAFVNQYNSCGEHGYGQFAVDFNQKFENAVLMNEDLSRHYFFVVRWAKELSEHFREKLECDDERRNEVNSFIFQPNAENDKNGGNLLGKWRIWGKDQYLLRRHDQFKKNKDHTFVWIITIAPSALFIYFHFFVTNGFFSSGFGRVICWLLLAVGPVVPLRYAFLGRKMVSSIQERMQHGSRDIVKSYERQKDRSRTESTSFLNS